MIVVQMIKDKVTWVHYLHNSKKENNNNKQWINPNNAYHKQLRKLDLLANRFWDQAKNLMI